MSVGVMAVYVHNWMAVDPQNSPLENNLVS